MRRVRLLIAVAMLFALCTMAFAENLAVQSKDGLGQYLVDSKGMTLYYFKKDSPGASKCAGPCLEKWPEFKGEAGGGIDPKELGTIAREDGKAQTVFRGYPLYYFVGDKNPGETKGQGLNDVWFVVDPNVFMK